jgi:hypothetical protein
MSRVLLIAGLLLASSPFYARAAEPAPVVRKAPAKYGVALHRESLLYEVAVGERKLFGHDPEVASPDDPKNNYLLVRDKYGVGPGREHALGILTPPGREQPIDIRNVQKRDARALGRMIRNLLFADRKSEFAPEGGYEGWRVYANLNPAVPRLHVHGVPETASESTTIADWNAFAVEKGYTRVKQARGFNVWKWNGEDSAPNGWRVLAVADASLGRPSELDKLPAAQAKKTDKLIGDLWLATAKLAKGSQVEAARSDAQIVVRLSSGW